jgi:hypothetical protein
VKNKWIWLAIIILIGGLLFLFLRNNPTRGIDQLNSDGIRDDVAKAIAEKFPESEKKRAAAIQLARAFQMAIDHPDEALKVDHIYEKATGCLMAIEGVGPMDGPTGTSPIIEGFVVNSIQRNRSYIHYNAGLSGQIFSGPEGNITFCEFDPSKMRN